MPLPSDVWTNFVDSIPADLSLSFDHWPIILMIVVCFLAIYVLFRTLFPKRKKSGTGSGLFDDLGDWGDVGGGGGGD